ncbi:hypothetical protein ACFWBI_22475 [Streptomyces sp. NPDC059982]|uniref:hypothetical protein n=1 Tax=unclassified Streptomyces TaxID=2593676 RepID=UPI0036A4FA96
MSEQRVESTEQDRLERLRGLLSGSRAKEGVGRALGQSTFGNVLVGAMLHGADRVRQGHEPTDLEKLVLDAVGTVLTEDELKAWGGVYREALDAGGALAVVPQTFANRTVEEGYGIEDLRADLPQMIADAMAAPNVQIIDPRSADRDEDDPAFLAAMRESKFAVTAFGIPGETFGFDDDARDGTAQAPGDDGDGGADGGVAQSYGVRLEAESFYVERAVGDQGGTKDEIFWTASAGTASGGRTFTSETFGAVEKGQTRHFSTGNKVLFEGSTSGDYLGTYITVWEKDQDNDAWWAALTKALNDAMKQLNQTLQFDDFFTQVLPVWVSIANAAAGLLLIVIDAFRNHSDISCQRAIGMGRYELAMLSRSGATTWRFNGDGSHNLRVKYTGPHVPFAEGTLEYAVHGATGWGTPQPLPFRTITTPALSAYTDRLYAAYLRPHDQAVMWTSMDANGNWTVPAQIGGDQSWFAPALTWAHGKLIYAVTGKNGAIFTRTFTPSQGWSAPSQLPGNAKQAPALATYADRAWLTHVGAHNTLHHSLFNGSTWSGWGPDHLHWEVPSHVAMAPQGDRLWRVATMADQQIHTSINGGVNGGNWVSQGTLGTSRATHAPALANNAGTLHIFLRGQNGALWASHYDGGFKGIHQVPGARPVEAPAAASFNSKLHVMYRRQG